MKYILLWSGEEGIEVSSTWDLFITESNTLGPVRKICGLKSNFRIARLKLRSMKQDKGVLMRI